VSDVAARASLNQIDLDGSDSRVHLGQVMLIVRLNEQKAMRAAFAADRDRLFGGQHRVGSIPRSYTSQGLDPSDWKGS